MFKQICVEQFKDEALMVSEVDMLFHTHYIVLIIFVLFHQKFQKSRLLLSKLVIDLSVSVDLNCHSFARLMVMATHNLGKATLSKNPQNLKPIVDLVAWLHDEVALFIIAVFLSFSLPTNGPFDYISWVVDHFFTLIAFVFVI